MFWTDEDIQPSVDLAEKMKLMLIGQLGLS